MKTNKKVLLIVFIMLSFLSATIIGNVWIHFISFGKKTTIEKANSIAESVRDGLTAHMVHGAMDKKAMFLRNMVKHQDVKTLRVIRSKENMEGFGDKKLVYAAYDEIERKVLKTGKTMTREEKDGLRITIPYIASSSGEPDCLKCHTNVTDGDVLGAITLELNTDEVKKTTYRTIIEIITISLLFLIISYLIALYFIKPYIKLFDDLEEGISRAYKGDYSHYVSTNLTNDAGRVAKRLNDLSEIFKFKKTIELDENTDSIYERISYILENSFKIEEFIIFENKLVDRTRKTVYKSAKAEYINAKEMEESKESCRANRTSNVVSSQDFHKVCKLCYRKEKESICLPFAISENISLTLLIYVEQREELERINALVPIIKNYFELAEPVLQTKILMKQLHDTTLVDPMTGLNNRRFLDDCLNSDRLKDMSFSCMMVDIDLFKAVNDTYGHSVGDDVIKRIAKVLRNNIKGSDYAIRYGGEEFLLITFDTTKNVAFNIGESIRLEFADQVFKTEKESFKKSLSLGIANYPEDSNIIWDVIKFSDLALYHAKEHGRNKVVIYEEYMNISKNA